MVKKFNKPKKAPKMGIRWCFCFQPWENLRPAQRAKISCLMRQIPDGRPFFEKYENIVHVVWVAVVNLQQVGVRVGEQVGVLQQPPPASRPLNKGDSERKVGKWGCLSLMALYGSYCGTIHLVWKHYSGAA